MNFGLQDLAHSLFGALDADKFSNPLNFSSSERVAFLLVDGLGADALEKYKSEAPTLAALTQLPILSTTFPSTTATALATLGTGEFPGAHGMLGYTIKVPHSGEPGRLINALKWDERVDPVLWQKSETLYERAIELGIKSTYIAARRYEGTGFTRATLRGADYVGANRFDEMVTAAKAALSKPHSFAYLYVNNIDNAGHNDGVGSEKWLDALRIVDGLVKDLIAAMPAGTSFYLSADHGMINSDEYCILGQENSLMEDISLVGGEPRARHLYVRDGSAHDVAARYSEYLGDRADVFVKTDAQSLFGIATEHAIERMGDVVVVPHGSLLLVDPDRVKQECAMIGHHGGRTQIEVEIPLLSAQI